MNCFGVLYGAYLLVYAAMPGLYPVTAADFNWAPVRHARPEHYCMDFADLCNQQVMFGGVAILGLIFYLVSARKGYHGPVVHVITD